MSSSSIFRPNSGARQFLLYNIFWGVSFGCFMAMLNNYLVDIHNFNPAHRGVLEFFRELPGLCLVFILAALYRVSDWKIMRLGAIIAVVGVTALALPVHYIPMCFFVTLWAFGEHVVMPIKSTVAMQLAQPGKGGRALGILSSANNAGFVLGNGVVAAVFGVGAYLAMSDSKIHKLLEFLGIDSAPLGAYLMAPENKVVLYNTVWILAGCLVFLAFLCTFSKHIVDAPSKRPKLLFRKKFSIFYALELSYGARKQIFLTFGPFVLIKIYGVGPAQIAMLMALSALINMFIGPAVGRLIDKLGYRTIMIADTLFLFWVCLLYGFAHNIFPMHIAVWMVAVNFLLDAALSTTAMATSLYVKDISANQDEVTATLSTGISTNHLVAIMAAPLGGWVWVTFGVGTLFVFSALMALANSGIAALIPRKQNPVLHT